MFCWLWIGENYIHTEARGLEGHWKPLPLGFCHPITLTLVDCLSFLDFPIFLWDAERERERHSFTLRVTFDIICKMTQLNLSHIDELSHPFLFVECRYSLWSLDVSTFYFLAQKSSFVGHTSSHVTPSSPSNYTSNSTDHETEDLPQ